MQTVLTDEQVFLYLDAALERMEADSQRAFHDAVEAVRIGTVVAQDAKALGRWRSLQARAQSVASRAVHGTTGRGLAGAELEQVIYAMAVTNPDIVAIHG